MTVLFPDLLHWDFWTKFFFFFNLRCLTRKRVKTQGVSYEFNSRYSRSEGMIEEQFSLLPALHTSE